MSTLFSGHYLRNRSTLDIGVLGYIGIVQHKEHSPEVWSVPPVTPCIYTQTHINTLTHAHAYTHTLTHKATCPFMLQTAIKITCHCMASLIDHFIILTAK